MIKKMKILLFLNGINSDWFVKKSYIDNEGIEGETNFKDGRWLYTAPCGMWAKWPSERRTPAYWRIQYQSESPGHKFTQIRLIHLHMVR